MKPDISPATKTGHFNLLTTRSVFICHTQCGYFARCPMGLESLRSINPYQPGLLWVDGRAVSSITIAFWFAFVIHPYETLTSCFHSWRAP